MSWHMDGVYTPISVTGFWANMKTNYEVRTTAVSDDAISKAKARFPSRCPKCAASVKDLEKHLRKVHPKRRIQKKEKRARKANPITPKWADEGNFKRGMIVQGGLANGK